MKQTNLRHEFVELIPATLEEGVLYVSIPYATAMHLCCCGCGTKVSTELSPAGWAITYDGETVSLDPSIGNWSFECKSHYWITRNTVRPARRFTRQEIELNQQRDVQALEQHLAGSATAGEPTSAKVTSRPGPWRRLRTSLRR